MDPQEILLSLVKAWKISEKPEYRKFRCASCQMPLTGEVVHYFLHTGGYLCPVHMCAVCNEKFEKNELKIDSSVTVDGDYFSKNDHSILSGDTIEKLNDIVSFWDSSTFPIKKELSCDRCNMALESDRDGYPKGWHVWYEKKRTLCELHFDSSCATKLGISI